MSTFVARTASTIALFAVIIAVVWWAPLPLYTLVASGFIVAGSLELVDALRAKGWQVSRWLSVGAAAAIPWIIWYQRGSWEHLVAYLTLAFVAVAAAQLRRKDNAEAIGAIAGWCLVVWYIGWCFSFVVLIRTLPQWHNPFLPYADRIGRGLVLLVIAITKGSDIAAYLIGSRIGRTPWLPRVSPRKTVEGLCGALAGGGVVGLIGWPWVIGGSWAAALTGAVLGVILGTVGQAGDLVASVMKRDAQMKDFSRAVPGIGGILDVIDSLLLTMPLAYLIMRFGGIGRW